MEDFDMLALQWILNTLTGLVPVCLFWIYAQGVTCCVEIDYVKSNQIDSLLFLLALATLSGVVFNFNERLKIEDSERLLVFVIVFQLVSILVSSTMVYIFVDRIVSLPVADTQSAPMELLVIGLIALVVILPRLMMAPVQILQHLQEQRV